MYQSLNRLDEAETMFKSCLQERQKTLGLENPETLQTIGNLARLYDEQKKYSEAETLYKMLLDRSKSRYGDNATEVYDVLEDLVSNRIE